MSRGRRNRAEPSGLAALQTVTRRVVPYAVVMGSRGFVGASASRPNIPGKTGEQLKGTQAHWVVQGIIPGSSPGAAQFVYVTVAYGRTAARKASPVSRAGELLYGFCTGENTRIETWRANFPALDPAWGKEVAGQVVITSRTKLLNWASAPGRNLIRDDEVAELKERLKPDPQLSKLGAERLAAKDWKRRFPEIHTRPLVTGQTVLKEAPYAPPKKK